MLSLLCAENRTNASNHVNMVRDHPPDRIAVLLTIVLKQRQITGRRRKEEERSRWLMACGDLQSTGLGLQIRSWIGRRPGASEWFEAGERRGLPTLQPARQVLARSRAGAGAARWTRPPAM